MVKKKINALMELNGLKHKFSDLLCEAGVEWLKSLELPSLNQLILDN
jgi:hypothetical protein